jgi:hypothetical protein
MIFPTAFFSVAPRPGFKHAGWTGSGTRAGRAETGDGAQEICARTPDNAQKTAFQEAVMQLLRQQREVTGRYILYTVWTQFHGLVRL